MKLSEMEYSSFSGSMYILRLFVLWFWLLSYFCLTGSSKYPVIAFALSTLASWPLIIPIIPFSKKLQRYCLLVWDNQHLLLSLLFGMLLLGSVGGYLVSDWLIQTEYTKLDGSDAVMTIVFVAFSFVMAEFCFRERVTQLRTVLPVFLFLLSMVILVSSITTLVIFR